ncbi:MAG TPA: S8 family serine peptidase [Pyrinomonadaceae bacterium]|nr:S8 family serine peptidase [Pyrinomonadaceae bacterium]
MRSRRPPAQSSLLSPRFISIAVFLFAVVLIPVIGYLTPKAGAQSQRLSLAPGTPAPKKNDSVPGELLVRFRRGTSLSRLKSRASLNIATATGRNLRIDVNHFGGSDLVEGLMLARVAVEDTHAALQALRARADVQYAEPNYIRYADVVPNDTSYASLWAMKDTGGGIFAESAWNTTTGSHNVVVGVIDSGIDIEHRDLKDNIFINTGEIPGNNIDDDNNGFIDDVNGWDFSSNDKTVFDNANDDAHGTHVAGTIGARGNNGAGVVGVNWDVQLLPMKALGPQGASDATLLGAYNYAKMMRQRGVNLRVLNNSYGGQRFSQSLFDAVKELGDAGILFVAAAGNDTLDNDLVRHFPGSFDLPNVICVASSTQQGFFSSFFSNFGNQTVHLAAPGENILSTTPRGYTGDGVVPSLTEADGSTYTNASGTSMSTPHVSGTAALVLAANPSINLQKLRAVLLFGNEHTGSFFFTTITGGRLNANRALQFAAEDDTTPPAPAPEVHIHQQNGRTVQFGYRNSGDDGLTGNASLNEFYFTDGFTGEQIRLKSEEPGNPNTSTSIFLNIPYKHTSGQLSLRTTDNVGNTSTASVDVTVPIDIADPYTVNTASAAPLTALNSGIPLNIKGDDITKGISLPFPFPFFGASMTSAAISTNGAIYFAIPPDISVPNPNFGPFDFAVASQSNLQNLAMIAGMWADLRTDRNATDNVYLVQPDVDHVIFRWQGVTFGAETPVNFEIELVRDGTIKTRYGSGNENLRPVIVGIASGEREAYPVASHISENAPLSLTNAQSVTFALRNPPPPPVADLALIVTTSAEPVAPGQILTFQVIVRNLGPNAADLLNMTAVLPAGLSFINCAPNQFGATCTHSSGIVTGAMSTFQPSAFSGDIQFTITVRVDAAAGASLQTNISATSVRPDPNPTNNSRVVSTNVVTQTFFGNARAISAGNAHTTSVRNDGTVWSWGRGFQGELGDGISGEGANTLTPLQVPGIDGVDTVDENNAFVLALKSNGTVWAWGTNFSGQSGNGNGFFISTRPVQTVGLTNVKGITAGGAFGAAVKTDGTVWIWGATGGLTGIIESNRTPIQLAGVTNVSAIAAGGNHLLLLKEDKTLWAVGFNTRGQLGNGTSTNSTIPVQVTGLLNVSRISAGEEFSVAVKADGTVWAWGLNANGQLGPGGGSMDFNAHSNPVQVTGLPAGMTNVSANDTYSLGLAGDGTVWSWGNGQSTPRQVQNFGNVTAIAAGENHSVALKADGSVWCWGLNTQGEFGDGTSNVVTTTPVRPSGLERTNSPAINPPGGKFFSAVDVTMTSPTVGATVRYTLNGADPTENDQVLAAGQTIHITSNTVVRARAWRSGMVPSGVSLVGFEQTTPSGPPVLFLDEFNTGTSRLAALDALMWTPEPFSVINPGNLLKPANDPNTRVSIFAVNLQLFAGETAASVTVSLTDANNVVFNIPAEDLRQVQALDLIRVTFRLPNNLAPGPCQVKLIAHNLTSNIGTIRIN